MESIEAFNQEDDQQDRNFILYNEWRYLMENELRRTNQNQGGQAGVCCYP
jgi:hypothetical protein